MSHRGQDCARTRSNTQYRLAFPILALFVVIAMAGPSALAQTFSVIHSFNFSDGAVPLSGIVRDQAGNLYGTTRDGGWFGNNCQTFNENGCGTVFKMSNHGNGWGLQSLYIFHWNDGAYPLAPVTIASNGWVFGTTGFGGTGSANQGVVFSLNPSPTPPASAIYSWTESLSHEFTGGDDGGPVPGPVIFDAAGNLYGATAWGGSYGGGVVYELTPTQNGWTETVLHNFSGTSDGEFPRGVVADATAQHLFGVTGSRGGNGCNGGGCGTVFELTRSGSSWTFTTLYTFTDGADGAWPRGVPIMDAAGNLYGTTPGGDLSDGSVWKMSPTQGGWSFSVLHTFSGGSNLGPYGPVAMDTAGNLYGTTYGGGAYRQGTVFELSPSNGGWRETDLYNFTGGSDGGTPTGSVAVDGAGNIYGTASLGGISSDAGVVWEITP